MDVTVTEPDSPLAEALSFVVEKGPYRYNAFRLGGAAPDIESGIMPVEPAADPGSVHQALSLLAVAEYRLMYELFWFWPAGPDDPALERLAPGDPAAAREIWETDRHDSGPAAVLATHNLAVLNQIEASESPAGNTFHPWLDGIDLWDEALRTDTFWQYLEDRMGAIDEQPPRHGVAELRRLLPDALLEVFARFFSRSARQHDAEALNAQLIALDELIHRDSDPASVFSAQLLDKAAQAVAHQLADALVDTVEKIADLFIATTTDHSRIDQAIAGAGFLPAGIRDDLGFIRREVTGTDPIFDREGLGELTARVLLDIGQAVLEHAEPVLEALAYLGGRSTVAAAFRCVWHMTMWCDSEAARGGEVTVFREGLLARARALDARMGAEAAAPHAAVSDCAPVEVALHITAIDALIYMSRNTYVHAPEEYARDAADKIALMTDLGAIPVRELRGLGHPGDERIRRVIRDLALDMMVTLAGYLGVVGNNKEYARLYHRAESLVDVAPMRDALDTLNATLDWGKRTPLIDAHRRAVRGGIFGIRRGRG
ncbi:hypothetical protein [Nocardia wallacei]|uniref:hypothetical protein n=1 Tax=Nocardia wallacei TaxID=480035 RepID=UPI0024582E57|nr:hypothetical protein [Nocardia wallacei]